MGEASTRQLVLQRLRHDARATQGELMLGDERLCYMLENRPPRVAGVKEPGLSRIPAGVYPLRVRRHGRFYFDYKSRWRWFDGIAEILLPGWSDVLIHIGNYHKDTRGCPLTGTSLGEHAEFGLCVWGSSEAYARSYRDVIERAARGESIDIRDEVAA